MYLPVHANMDAQTSYECQTYDNQGCVNDDDTLLYEYECIYFIPFHVFQ